MRLQKSNSKIHFPPITKKSGVKSKVKNIFPTTFFKNIAMATIPSRQCLEQTTFSLSLYPIIKINILNNGQWDSGFVILAFVEEFVCHAKQILFWFHNKTRFYTVLFCNHLSLLHSLLLVLFEWRMVYECTLILTNVSIFLISTSSSQYTIQVLMGTDLLSSAVVLTW